MESADQPARLSPPPPSRPFLVRALAPPRRFFDGVPVLPISPATLLELDLLLGLRTFDVPALSEVVLSDLGAVLQLLRTAGRRDGDAPGVDGCIVRLGPRKLRAALTPKSPAEASRANAQVAELWQRARLTAELARVLSRRFSTIGPADAYLAGLLHEMGRIPAILSWKVQEIEVRDIASVGPLLAREWHVPEYLRPTLQFAAGPLKQWSPLQHVVSTARDLANAVMHGASLPRRIGATPGKNDPPTAGRVDPPAELRPIRIR
jgi:HD-like signal output (HDOD) protein